MTLHLEVPDELMQQLKEQAQAMNVAVEQLALMKLGASLPAAGSEPNTLDDDTFQHLAQGVVGDYREVLERLA